MIAVLTFDIVTTPSDPQIRVFASTNDVTYVEATSVSRNGYRVNAWIPKQPVKFLRIEISPSHPDQIGGSTFTFGLTSFSAAAVDFHLYSEVAFRPITFEPLSATVRFRADGEGLVYFLSFGSGRVIKVEPDQVITLPGVAKVTVDTHINTNWQMCPLASETALQLPVNVYPSTIAILDVDDTVAVRVAYNMNPAVVTDVITNTYALIWNRNINRYPKSDDLYIDESARRWRTTYVHGPATLEANLSVRLESRDSTRTPVFRGAYLENVY